MNTRSPFALLFAALTLMPANLNARDTSPEVDEGTSLESRQRGDMTARLNVRVLDRGPGPERGTVRFTLTVEGSATLAVQPVQLTDATSAWKVAQRASAWTPDGDRVVWTQSIWLEQVKPGVMQLPDAKVRFRESTSADWQEAEWTEILKTIRDIAPPEPVPPAPAPWPRWPWVAVALVLLIAVAWILRGRWAEKTAPLPPDQWALRELERIERTVLPPAGEVDVFHTQTSNVVRRYLQERFGLRAPQQTTAEFLATPLPQLTAPQQDLLRDFFERCDLAKFARAGASSDDCRRATELARSFVQQTAAREPQPTEPTARSQP
jgi:hypothetical protein